MGWQGIIFMLMDLFDHALNERMQSEAPLAARLRPNSLDEFVGQEEIIGPGKLLRRAIETDKLFSSILFSGPPGTGKTTLAQADRQATPRPSSFPSRRCWPGLPTCAPSSRLPRSAASSTRAARSCLWMRSTAGTKPSRMRSCRMWKAACSP